MRGYGETNLMVINKSCVQNIWIENYINFMNLQLMGVNFSTVHKVVMYVELLSITCINYMLKYYILH